MSNDIISCLDRIASKKPKRNDGGYEKDGLLYCGTCNTPKQCRIPFAGQVKIVTCLCSCSKKAYDDQRAEDKSREEKHKLEILRNECLKEYPQLAKFNFQNSAQSPLMDRCIKYVQNWQEVRKRNLGLLLYGETGGGKTHAASCIAGELMMQGVPVMLTTFPNILNKPFEQRDEILERMKKVPLVVIDDLGVERETRIAMEIVFSVVDQRVKSQKPMIITTNLPIEEFKKPKNLEFARIYERILEVCTPIYVPKTNARREIGSDREEFAKKLLGL